MNDPNLDELDEDRDPQEDALDHLFEEESEDDPSLDAVLAEPDELRKRDAQALDSLLRDEIESKASEFRMRSADIDASFLEQERAKAKDVEEGWEEADKKQAIGRGLKWLGMCLIILACGAALWSTVKLRTAPNPVQVESTESSPSGLTVKKQLFSACERYLAASSIDEKVSISRGGELLRPMMERYYSSVEFQPKVLAELTSTEPFLVAGQSGWKVECLLDDGSTDSLVLGTHEEYGYKVSWVSDVSYQENDLKKFIDQGVTEPTAFRVRMTPMAKKGYYGYEYLDYREFRCFLLEIEDRGQVRELWAYTRLNTEVHEDLIKELRWAAAGHIWENKRGYFPMTVLLKYAPERMSADCVEIVGVAKFDWFLALPPHPTTQP